ncbi:MAG: hypothetical protein OXD50_05795 [Chloroflexi bacterium]|nr:hypothetical protein [Chloroflexota bacterium]
MLRKLGILGLGVPLIAIIVALGYLFFFGETEPTFEDATQQLASDHTVYGLDLEGRRAALVAPFGSDPSQELPLIIALHGYGSNVWEHSQYMGLIPRVNLDRFLLLMPNGTRDSDGNRFWNATDYCCDFEDSEVDDVQYLRSLIDEASELVRLGSIYAVGQSNGGFMSFRLACESLPGLAGIVSLAGTTFSDESRCADAAPVSMLQIHGDADDVILYDGDEYPRAPETVMRWARRLGCDFNNAETLDDIDLDVAIQGVDTRVVRYRQGCAEGVTIEHWRIVGGEHTPTFDSELIGERVVGWLLEEAGR